ncbi:MAG TPA: VOC family protein [Steroidobacteraceae bacterium]|nr:VOC family protein [Steroidobacteraceae bacterium]
MADIAVHTKLFVGIFGGTFVQKGALSAVKFPNMLVALRKTASAGPSQGSVLDHFGFKVRDIAAMRSELEALGYTVHDEFKGVEGFPNAYVDGPDGLRLEMQEDVSLSVKALPNHVHFFTPDYAKLLDWYADAFALAKKNRGRMQTTADVGTVNLSFTTSSRPVVATQGRTVDHIGFEVTNLDAFLKQLEAKGIKPDSPMTELPSLGLKVAFLTDPSGTYIELTEGLSAY